MIESQGLASSQPAVPVPLAQLLAECYEDVRRVARRMLANDGQRRALQATELANEAMLRLIGAPGIDVHNQAHVLALAARTMRRVLIDEARKGAAGKRQAPRMVTVWPDDPQHQLIEIHELDRALAALDHVSPVHAQVVELRFMLGMTVEEASKASGVPERTIKRHWQSARAWLLDFLRGSDA